MNINELIQMKNNFVSELRQASQGQKTSLPFITHTLSQQPIVSGIDTFQILVIGGSYYQEALMQREGTGLRIISQSQGEQPVFGTEADLMGFIDRHINPETSVVGLNFAYPLTPVNRNGNLDGILQNGSKENLFEGLVGAQVGERIEQYLNEKRKQQIHIAIANDTICLLLSGLTHHTWHELAAGIVGTGINFALFENAHTAVNLESGSFDKFTPTEAGQDIDSHSVVPGDAKFEKEVSGAYLFKHFNYYTKKSGIPMDPIGTSQQLDFLVSAPTAEIAHLANDLLRQSASLVAVQIAGILEYQQRDLAFIMQGSMYWKGYQYKETVDQIVKTLCPHYKASYEHIVQSDLYGAAKLVA